MKLNIKKQVLKNKSNPFKKQSTEFETTWLLELSDVEQALLQEYELDEIILINFCEHEDKSKPVPIRARDLQKGVSFSAPDVWWVLDCDKNLRQVCSDLLTLMDDMRSFAGSETIEIKKTNK